MLMVSLSINIGYAICSQEQPMTSEFGKLLALLALLLLVPAVTTSTTGAATTTCAATASTTAAAAATTAIHVKYYHYRCGCYQ
jgi:hypothetical protein